MPEPMVSGNPMAKIFLCYAREDQTQVAEIYRHLQELGFQPWMDKFDLIPGQRWRQEIPKALQDSDFIFIFFSRHSVAGRGYVQREFKLALDTLQEIPEDMIHTIPIRLDTCAIPTQFGFLQWCDFFETDGWQRIEHAIKTGLGRVCKPCFGLYIS